MERGAAAPASQRMTATLVSRAPSRRRSSGSGLVAGSQLAAGASSRRPAPQQAVLNRYCVTCHNEKLKTGGLALDTLDLDRVGADAETWEKVVRKLRAGLMPPAGARRPDRATLDAFAAAIEGAHRSRRRRESQSGPDAAASHEPRRVRQRDPRSARAGRRSDDAAAGRRFEPRLRQHRRRAGRVAVAARALRVGGGQDQPAGRRRSRRRAARQSPTRSRAISVRTGTLEGQPLGTRGGTVVRHNFPRRRRVPDQAVAD